MDNEFNEDLKKKRYILDTLEAAINNSSVVDYFTEFGFCSHFSMIVVDELAKDFHGDITLLAKHSSGIFKGQYAFGWYLNDCYKRDPRLRREDHVKRTIARLRKELNID